jgi:hypothetical protein
LRLEKMDSLPLALPLEHSAGNDTTKSDYSVVEQRRHFSAAFIVLKGLRGPNGPSN